MAEASAAHAAPGRGEPVFRADRVYLGWQFAQLNPHPGSQPRRPTPPEREQLSPDWVAAQRREENLLNRPLKLACGAALAVMVALLTLWFTGLLAALPAALGALVLALVAGICGYPVWQGEQAIRARVGQERARLGKIHAEQDSRLTAWHAEHARRFHDWQAHRAAYERQPQWYAVSLPSDLDRVDVAGGTLSGWSALCTGLGAARLLAGGELTVIDLSEGAVAAELVSVAGRLGIDPHVWVLPVDLPRLDITVGLAGAELADVLSLVVSVSEDRGGTREASFDNAILERVIEVFGGQATVAEIGAALRALAQVGDPRDDIRLGLIDAGQLERIGTLFGRGAADRIVIERAWAMESQLRKLEKLAIAPARLPPARLRVVATDRRAGVFGNTVLGTFVVTALTHLLRQATPAEPWQHTVALYGAEKLRGDVLDRLCEACEHTDTGLVLAYRSIPAQVRERLGRGNAAVAFMRLGNAEDAKAASEQIGAEHRFVLSQLTQTVGTEVTESTGDSYTSTVAATGSVTATSSASEMAGLSHGRGRSRDSNLMPLAGSVRSRGTDASYSHSASDSLAVAEGITTSTAWGLSTTRAAAGSQSLAAVAARSRELLVEPHELQQLPPSAMIVTYAGSAGRRIALVDVNPAIAVLPAATMLDLDEARSAPWAASLPGPTGTGLLPGAPGAGPGAGGAAGPGAGGAAGPGAGPGGGPDSGARGDGGPREPRPSGPAPGQRRPAPANWHGEDRPPPNVGPPPSRLDWRDKPPGRG